MDTGEVNTMSFYFPCLRLRTVYEHRENKNLFFFKTRANSHASNRHVSTQDNVIYARMCKTNKRLKV